MEVKQVYEIVNAATSEVLGESALLAEDLSNVVDVGAAVFDNNSFDAYSRSLVDHIGKVVFVNRKYSGFAPNVLRDGWDYGAVLQKVATKIPDATVNEDWELVAGQSYDPNVFNPAEVVSRFWNKRITFEIERSITEEQLKSAFSSAEQLNGFVSMIFNEVDKSLTVKMDALVMRLINNMVADTIYDDYNGGTLSSGTGVKAVNLLYKYNTDYGLTGDDALTTSDCMYNPDFLRYASEQIGLYVGYLKGLSTLFNIGGEARFTPEDKLHVVLLNQFDAASKAYLQSDTFHKELVALPNHEVVPYWQGSGTSYAFADTSKIYATSANNHSLNSSGILAVMFDHDALGICNERDKVTTNYNAKGGFTNYFYKRFEGAFNDENENFVVFFVA